MTQTAPTNDTSQDPRFRNTYGDADNLSQFVTAYADRLADTLKAVDQDALGRAIDVVAASAEAGRRIYVAGNGGSAAIGDHLCCDFTKGTYVDGHPPLKSHSLTSNSALYTALANDFSFDEVLARQVGYYAEAGDVLIAVSSSGNSENILRAVACARHAGMTVIGLSGFTGGTLREACDISLYTPVDNYGLVEDSHQALMHMIAQVIVIRREHGVSW